MKQPPQRVTELYAWIATERDGGEGVPAASMVVDGQLMLVPLIGADLARLESLRPTAVAVANESGCPVRLRRFVLAPDE